MHPKLSENRIGFTKGQRVSDNGVCTLCTGLQHRNTAEWRS